MYSSNPSSGRDMLFGGADELGGGGTGGDPGVDVGPTGRHRKQFPDPVRLKRHGPARIIAMCNQ
ncbi:MAG TPA: hypothetical protein VFG96_08235, partial [Jiangellaceae bacterium]|nr:hypothetical protein [Jiangellaceae bacterium]